MRTLMILVLLNTTTVVSGCSNDSPPTLLAVLFTFVVRGLLSGANAA